MTSRLMLNLRTEALRRGTVFQDQQSRITFRPFHYTGRTTGSGTTTRPSGSAVGASDADAEQVTEGTEGRTTDYKTFEASIIGNLGAPLTTWSDDDKEAMESDEEFGGGPYGEGDVGHGDMEMQTRTQAQTQTRSRTRSEHAEGRQHPGGMQQVPVSVKVRVEEEVVVEVEDIPTPLPVASLTRISSTAHSHSHTHSHSHAHLPSSDLSSKPLSSYLGRRPWTAPPTWRLSRERQRGLMQDIYRIS